MGSSAGCSQLLQVLFCGEEFSRGFQYTKEACAGLPDVEVTRCPRSELPHRIAAARVLVPLMTRLDAPLLHKAGQAELILQYGVGLEGVDVQTATQLGIQVSNIPSDACGNALSCAEMAVFLLLSCLRQAHQMRDSVQQQRLGLPIGQTLFGKTCLLVGFGNIARALVPRLRAFGVRLLVARQSAWEPDAATEEPAASVQLRGSWAELHALAGQADLVVLTCTQTPVTEGLVNERFLAACKPGVVVVNVARGGLLEYGAVRAGLESGAIGALGLDVQWQEPFDPADPLAQHARVYLTPHVAGVTELSYRGMAEVVAQEVARLQQGLPSTVRINSPAPGRRRLPDQPADAC